MQARIISEETRTAVNSVIVVAYDETEAQIAVQEFCDEKPDASKYQYDVKGHPYQFEDHEAEELLTNDEKENNLKVFKVKYDC